MTKYNSKVCPTCGRIISLSNFNRHYTACAISASQSYKTLIAVSARSLNCIYCGKLCKNKNSLAQHEVRCSQNPNRRDATKLAAYIESNIKGQTKATCTSIRKQSETVLEKYAQGYVSPVKGRKVIFDYIYEEHNEQEIQRWLDFITARKEHLTISAPESHSFVEGYVWYSAENMFMQNYVISKFLDGNYSKYTIHHINRKRDDNRIENLMIFSSGNDHKRFHNSKYAYLTYDSTTFLFSCELRK